MKITHESPEQLILENKPIWLALAISVFGLVFFGIGLSMMSENFGQAVAFMLGGLGVGIGFNVIFIRRTQLILDASADKITLRRRGWLGDTQMSWALHHLTHAVVETSNSGDSTTYRAALVIGGGMDAGTHPLTIVYSSGSGARRAQDAINGWLDSQGPAA